MRSDKTATAGVDTTATASQTREATVEDAQVLVEDVSIDGMCGVY